MKKKIYQICAVAVPLLWISHTTTAQIGVNINMNTNSGLYVAGEIDSKIKGSPYLFDGWAKGSVKLQDGSTYNDLPLMFDVSQNRVIFKSAEGNAQIFKVPVEEFSFDFTTLNAAQKRVFKKGFPAGDNGNTETFYEVLSDGNTKFLKKIIKQLTEEIAPGAITPSKQLKEVEKYYIVKDNKLVKVKRDKKSIISLLNNKASELENFISTNKLNLKEEDDIVKLINYYNRLG